MHLCTLISCTVLAWSWALGEIAPAANGCLGTGGCVSGREGPVNCELWALGAVRGWVEGLQASTRVKIFFMVMLLATATARAGTRGLAAAV